MDEQRSQEVDHSVIPDPFMCWHCGVVVDGVEDQRVERDGNQFCSEKCANSTEPHWHECCRVCGSPPAQKRSYCT